MKRFTLYMGLNDKDTKTQQISIVEAYKIVSNILASDFGGGTIYEAKGVTNMMMVLSCLRIR